MFLNRIKLILHYKNANDFEFPLHTYEHLFVHKTSMSLFIHCAQIECDKTQNTFFLGSQMPGKRKGFDCVGIGMKNVRQLIQPICETNEYSFQGESYVIISD